MAEQKTALKTALKDDAACGTEPAPPCTLVIFGAGGDLTKRLLMPSLYNLAGAGLLPEGFSILGVDHSDGTDESLRETLESTHRAALATNARPPRVLYTVPTGQNPTGASTGAPALMFIEVSVPSLFSCACMAAMVRFMYQIVVSLARLSML